MKLVFRRMCTPADASVTTNLHVSISSNILLTTCQVVVETPIQGMCAARHWVQHLSFRSALLNLYIFIDLLRMQRFVALLACHTVMEHNRSLNSWWHQLTHWAEGSVWKHSLYPRSLVIFLCILSTLAKIGITLTISNLWTLIIGKWVRHYQGFTNLRFAIVMYSCSTKGRVSLVIGKRKQRVRLQKRRWEEAEAEVARGRGRWQVSAICSIITRHWTLHLLFKKWHER